MLQKIDELIFRTVKRRLVIGCSRIETIFFNNFFFNFKKVVIKDNYKIVQYYFNSITVFLGPRDPLPGGGGVGRGIHEPRKPGKWY